MKDTFMRSCEHWSESSRNEMQNFYTLASVDYKHLAEKFNWKEWLEAHQANIGKRGLKLLDIACGSGKFPSALIQNANLSNAKILPVEYSLLDPSSFSIAEARKVFSHHLKLVQNLKLLYRNFLVSEKLMTLSGQRTLFTQFQKTNLKRL